MNTSSGGALLRVEVALEKGERLELGIGAKEEGEETPLVAVVETVHEAIPDGDSFQVGVRWLELRASSGEAVIRAFLERVLGMVNVHVREVKRPEEVSVYVFEFPVFYVRSTQPHARDLADLLEPASAAEVQAVHEEKSLQEGADDAFGSAPGGDGGALSNGGNAQSDLRSQPRFNPLGSEGSETYREGAPSWSEIELQLRGIAARSRAGRTAEDLQDPDALARKTTASTRNVPHMMLEIRGQGGKWRGQLTRIGFMSLDVFATGELPQTYQRVTVQLPIASGPSSKQTVKIAGTVSRIKADGRFTVRISRVDEGGYEGLFEAFVCVLIASDATQEWAN